MATGIRDSDGDPQPVDIQASSKYLNDMGEVNVHKIVHHLSRLERVEGLNQSATHALSEDVGFLRSEVSSLGNDVKELNGCLLGNPLRGQMGLIADHKESTSKIDQLLEYAKKDATTRQHTPQAALETKADPFLERFKGVIYFLAYFITTIIAVIALV